MREILTAISGWSKNYSDKPELNYARACRNVQDFLEGMPRDIMIWLAHCIDRQAMRSLPAWVVYQSALDSANANFVLVSQEAIDEYQTAAHETARRIVEKWAHDQARNL